MWKELNIKLVTTSFREGEIRLSNELLTFLNEEGLPLINTGNGLHFLPFTYFPNVNIKGEDFYLLGDYSRNFIGISFIGINMSNEKIYDIYLKQDTFSVINQSLGHFLKCLAYYNTFLNKYDTDIIDKETFRKDYQQLQDDLTRTDHKAMAAKNDFWKANIDLLEVNGYGDYLYNAGGIPDNENLPTQEEIDNMDLPF